MKSSKEVVRYVEDNKGFVAGVVIAVIFTAGVIAIVHRRRKKYLSQFRAAHPGSDDYDEYDDFDSSDLFDDDDDSTTIIDN